MGSITSDDTSSGKRYRVRYRKPDRSQTDKRGFKTKHDPELYLAPVEVSKARASTSTRGTGERGARRGIIVVGTPLCPRDEFRCGQNVGTWRQPRSLIPDFAPEFRGFCPPTAVPPQGLEP